MRFGVILPIQSKDAGLDVLWEELREEVATAEEAGFDAVFMTEFHQARGGAFVSPLLLGAGLLQGTTRIRFGTAVLATPLHHPVRLAEDLLMLDHITRGRVVLGMGIAHQVPDFQAFAVPPNWRRRPTRIASGENCDETTRPSPRSCAARSKPSPPHSMRTTRTGLPTSSRAIAIPAGPAPTMHTSDSTTRSAVISRPAQTTFFVSLCRS